MAYSSAVYPHCQNNDQSSMITFHPA